MFSPWKRPRGPWSLPWCHAGCLRFVIRGSQNVRVYEGNTHRNWVTGSSSTYYSLNNQLYIPEMVVIFHKKNNYTSIYIPSHVFFKSLHSWFIYIPQKQPFWGLLIHGSPGNDCRQRREKNRQVKTELKIFAKPWKKQPGLCINGK